MYKFNFKERLSHIKIYLFKLIQIEKPLENITMQLMFMSINHFNDT